MISIDDLKSEMAHILCNELPIAQSSRLQTPFSSMFKILTFHNLDFDTRVELNVFLSLVVLVAKSVKV